MFQLAFGPCPVD
jgi:hypothetical protein